MWIRIFFSTFGSHTAVGVVRLMAASSGVALLSATLTLVVFLSPLVVAISVEWTQIHLPTTPFDGVRAFETPEGGCVFNGTAVLCLRMTETPLVWHVLTMPTPAIKPYSAAGVLEVLVRCLCGFYVWVVVFCPLTRLSVFSTSFGGCIGICEGAHLCVLEFYNFPLFHFCHVDSIHSASQEWVLISITMELMWCAVSILPP